MTSDLPPDHPGTAGELLPGVYDELRKLARARLARERQSHQTLQPTALVHEAYLRVSGDGRQWDRRGHFFAAAALAMRRILVERARHYQRIKHGAGGEHVELDEAMLRADPELTVVIAIDEALSQLELADARQAKIVALRYFTGLSVEETAAAMDLSPATIKNEWASARAWLARKLGSLPEVPDEGFLDPARIPSLDMAAVDGPLQPGTVLGGFLVLHAIGSGGMGVVYAAQQDRPRRTVAIKVLRRGFRHPEILKRFEREAEMLGRLQHPGIAQVIAFHPGDRGSPAHLVMELVGGPPITEYAQALALDIHTRIKLIIAVCEAVQHAHDRGIVHRDLKPANVLVSDEGQPKVLDFGIARATGLDIYSTVQTSQGQLLGTLAFMSPEQLRGATEDVDGRSDVYALGVLFYRLMAGRLPFEVGGLQIVEAAQRILNSTAPPLGSIDPDLRGPVEQVAARAMSPERAHRYPSAAEFAADLRACIEGRSPASAGITDISSTARTSRVLVAESADGQLVATSLVSGVIIVMNAATGTQLATIPASAGDGPIERLSFEDDGRLSIRRAGGRVDVIVLAPPG